MRHTGVSFPRLFSFPSSKSTLKKASEVCLLTASPDGRKALCEPPASRLLREGPGDSVGRAGVLGGRPSKQALAQIGAADGETPLEVTQRDWLTHPAATGKRAEQSLAVSTTSDRAGGRLVFRGN